MGLFDFFTNRKKYDYVVLDTETTGLEHDDEIVEIAIVSNTGDVLLNTLVKPYSPMPTNCYAAKIHGITNGMLANAPSWDEIYPQVKNIVKNNKVIIYNEKFDSRLIEQTCSKYGLKSPLKQTHCAMLEYGAWFGDYRWHKLSKAVEFMDLSFEGQQHRALSDCLATLAVYQTMQTKKKYEIEAIWQEKNRQRQIEFGRYNQTLQNQIKQQVKEILDNPDWVILNINGKISTTLLLEITIMDMKGNILLDTFIQPARKISGNPKYLQKLNMNADDFLKYPKWNEVFEKISIICKEKTIFPLIDTDKTKEIINRENLKYQLDELNDEFKFGTIRFGNEQYHWQTIARVFNGRKATNHMNIYRSIYDCCEFLHTLNHIAEHGLGIWLYSDDDQNKLYDLNIQI